MDLLIAAVVLGVALVAAAAMLSRGRPSAAAAAVPAARAEASAERAQAAADVAQHRSTAAAAEELERRAEEIARRSAELDKRAAEFDQDRAQLAEARERLGRDRSLLQRELERVSGLSAGQAKAILLKEIEDEARHAHAKVLRQVEEETKREAERRVRNILSIAMQRLAASHAAETTVSVVQLTSDDMKGRIIGREGRNIRALENLTGVDFIIDDTPNAVVLSGFDGVRREVARMTLERLLEDGRIHPARIEETFYQAKSELESHIQASGEEAVLEANVGGLDADLIKLLGRLKFRTSYGQNVLAHSVETAHLAGLMADELGASAKTARRAALLHDIGKAVSHEVEPQTVEAVIVQAA
ncbi:MAG TPA: Rnase Y domain-containing protein, partial [Capillimicrobium sp.]